MYFTTCKENPPSICSRTTDTPWLNPKFFAGADKSAENTTNAPKLSVQIFCPSPKVWDFDMDMLIYIKRQFQYIVMGFQFSMKYFSKLQNMTHTCF